VLAQLLSSGLGGATYRDTFSLPGTETDKVVQLLDAAGRADQSGLTGQVVLHAESGTVAAAPDGVSAAFAQLCTDGLHVVGVATPWQSVQCANGRATMGPGQPSLLSADRTIAIADVSWHSNKYDQSLFDGVYNHLTKLRSADLQVEFTGDAFQGQGQDDGGIPPFLLGFIAALIILAIVFRTAGATALPLASAIAALTAGLGLIGVLSHVMDVSNITPQLTELMVIGVGVDYALFIVTRHRRNLRRGVSVPDSIAAAIDTSGRAVLFAGSTVCVAMLGLMALGVSFFYGMALGTAIAVSLTMLASLTLLPALLSFLGLRVLPRKQRREVAAGRFVDAETTGIWARWAGFVSRRPVALAALGGLVMVTLAIPFFAMRLGQADQGNDPAGTTTRKGYDLIAQGFGAGYNSTLSLVIDGPGAQSTAQHVGQALAGVTDVDPHSVYVPAQGLTPELSIVSFKSLSAPQDEATTNLVTHLRDDVLPPIYDGTGDHVYVFGQTAIQVDFTHVLAAKMPLFMAAHRSGDEPARRRCGVRRGRRDLPVGLVRRDARHRQGRSDRVLGAGHGVRDRVRAVHGLSGVPGEPDARGVGAHPRQPARGHHRAGGHRRHHHRRRGDHDRGLRRFRARPEPGRQAVRRRSGRSGVPRRVRVADDPGALAHAPARPVQLVLPEGAGPDHPAGVRRAAGCTGARRRRRAGARARPGLSQPASSSNAAPASRSSRSTRRAYAGVAFASPQAGVGTTRPARVAAGKPSSDHSRKIGWRTVSSVTAASVPGSVPSQSESPASTASPSAS
jgi:hypothetical protein